MKPSYLIDCTLTIQSSICYSFQNPRKLNLKQSLFRIQILEVAKIGQLKIIRKVKMVKNPLKIKFPPINLISEELNRRISPSNNIKIPIFILNNSTTMGAACGSARDSSTPSGNKANSQVSRSKNRKLTSLDDVINVKQRRSQQIKLSESEKKKLFDRKFSVKKEDMDKIRQAAELHLKDNRA